MHRVLLEDPTLLDAARDLISLGKSAGFAWREAIRAQIAVLTKIEDALLAERAADLRDIEKRVLRALGYTNAAARDVAGRSGAGGRRIHAVRSVVARPHARHRAGDGAWRRDLARGDSSRARAAFRRWSRSAMRCMRFPKARKSWSMRPPGRLEFAPTALDVERARLERQRLAGVREVNRRTSQQAAATHDGRAIEVAANIATLDDAKTAVENGADSVGLLRTELLFIHRAVGADHRRTSPKLSIDRRRTERPHRDHPHAGCRRGQGSRLPDAAARDRIRRSACAASASRRCARICSTTSCAACWRCKPLGAVRILLPMVTDVGELDPPAQAHR